MITIRKMTESEYNIVMKKADFDYAKDIAKTRNISLEEAINKAQKQIKELLPDGFYTKDHIFLCADFNENYAGFLWGVIKDEDNKRSGWIYNIYIEEEFRRLGIGQKLLEEIENKLTHLDVYELDLHVFAYNTNAISLYQKLGFQNTNIVMQKKLKNTLNE